MENLRLRLRPFLAGLAALGLATGLLAPLARLGAWSDAIWTLATVPVLLALLAEIVTSLRRGDVGLDIVAALSMTAALLVGETLAACIVALMYAGGQYLEGFAEKRARRDMTALLARVPRTAMRHRDGALEEVPLEQIEPGNRLLVRQGDVVPVDGTVAEGVAVLDQSALTGESLPIQHRASEAVMSGTTNVGEAFDLNASAPADESTYAGIVRLVEAAQRSRAPMARMADRYAILFLAVTVVLAGGAWWLTGDPIRAVAVLVVATPCPLILAVPVAIVAGLSRAAKLGILIKGGKAIEALAAVRALVIDKTGTLTQGEARIVATQVAEGWTADEVLRIAASLDQASKHIIGQTIVAAARERGLRLAVPTEVVETAGEGLTGRVDGHAVAVGGFHFVAGKVGGADLRQLSRDREPGAVGVAVAIDGKAAGVLILSDALRAGTEQLLQALRGLGIERIVLATGDRRDVARFVSMGLSIDSGALRAHPRPEDPGGAVRAQERPGDDDRRRRQRRAGARRRRSRRRHGRQGGGCVGRGGRRGAARRSPRPHPAGDPDRPPLAAHRLAERRRRHRAFDRRHGRGRLRLPAAGAGRAVAGGDRRRGHLQRAPGAARLSTAWLVPGRKPVPPLPGRDKRASLSLAPFSH